MNPFKMIQAAQNPMGMAQEQMLEKMRNQNPRMYNEVQKMIRGKSDDQLKEMAHNIAKERGIDLNQFASNFGIKL